MGEAVYIGLGSNLQDPVQQVTQAVRELSALPETRVTAQSPLYRSRALGPGQQPDYINAAARLDTNLQPLALLDHLQAIERRHGRRRTRRWGPRTLDLDILLWGNREIRLPRLRVPHPQLAKRNFVLYPLVDIDPALTLPKGGSLESLLAGCAPNHLALCAEHEQSGVFSGSDL